MPSSGQVSELEAVIPLLVNISEDEKDHLRYLIRSIVFVTIGITFLSTRYSVDADQRLQSVRASLSVARS